MERVKQTVSRLIEKYGLIFKLTFVLSVTLFVVITLGNFLKTVEWSRVGIEVTAMSPTTLLVLTVGGLVAVLPMTGYDIAITRLLPGKFSPFYIFRSGWITNTLTNVAGFGGVLGATLRAHFYGETASRRQIMAAIAKIAVFLLAGLSLLCWLALGIILTFRGTDQLHRYLPWLVGGGLYFPLALLFTRKNDSQLFAGFSGRLQLFITLTSTFEWLFVAGFFLLVGAQLGIRGNYWLILALYVVAQVIGVVSMLPGAIGSFDVIMLVELTVLGVPRASAVTWLLIFRLFYYLVPLALGLLFFIHYLAVRINNFFDGLPETLIRRTAHGLITIFMYVSAIVTILAAAVPDLAETNRILQRFYPFTFFFLHQLTTMLFAVLLLACARGIQAKVKKAYWPTLALLVVGIVNTLVNLETLSLAIFLAIILGLVILMRHTLYRDQLQYSPEKLTVDATILTANLILYSIVGIVNSPHFTAKHRIPVYFFFPGEKIWLSGFIGMLVGILLLVAVIWYFARGKDPFGPQQVVDATRVQAVIDRFGGNETSHLALLGDKNLYYYQEDGQDQLFFMYQARQGRLVVMGDPVGNCAYWRPAVRQFIEEADRHDYQLVFYEVGEEMTVLLHEFGFDFLKTGEDGRVTLADFTLAGKKQRSQRALMHKFEREGYQFAIVQPPFDAGQVAELKAVSDDWLGKQSEKGFSLGYFSPAYINTAPVATVRDTEGQLVAFATLMPTGGKDLLTIDLMRHRQDAPSGIMDMIFISLFQYGQQEGYQAFDLGMAPLSKVGDSQFAFLAEKMAHLIYEYGSDLYRFQGLRHYKEKYASYWLPRYTVYRKQGSLVGAMLAVVAVVNRRIDQPAKNNKKIWLLWWKMLE